MANNKDTKKSDTMGNKPDREFEGQGRNQRSGMGTHDKQTSGSQGNFEDNEKTTAGGRQGKFSDSESAGDAQWSPGSNQESDR